MPPAKKLYDEILGLLTWDDRESVWTFEAGPIDGRSVRGALFPESRREPLSTFRRETVRDFMEWIHRNESSIREQLTAELFDWWREGCDGQEAVAADTPEEFRDRLVLRCIFFWDDGRKAQVAYEQAGWILLVKVRMGCTLEPGVDVFEPGALGQSRLFREASEPGSEGRPQSDNLDGVPQSTAITNGLKSQSDKGGKATSSLFRPS